MNQFLRSFQAFQIQITSRCNLRCGHCTKNTFASEWVDGDMDMATYHAIAAAFPYLKQVYINAWGEPLLHPNFWEMVAIARAAGCSVGFTTNGILIDEEVAQRLAREVEVVGISLDGATAATYESIRRGTKFAHVVERVRLLTAARIRSGSGGLPLVSLLFLKTRRNIHELPAIVDLAADLGADEIIASNLTYIARPELESQKVYSLQAPKPEYLAILDKARQRAESLGLSLRIYPLEPKRVAYCEARPLEELHITWDGYVAPCVYLTLPIKGNFLAKVYEEEIYRVPVTRFGNVKGKGIMEIWNSEAYQKFRAPFAARKAICGNQRFGITDDGGFAEINADTFAALAPCPLPEVCHGCYKAMGI
jgi:MoaA/NifB/PqqE/SkfB family radical SAM enzyme